MGNVCGSHSHSIHTWALNERTRALAEAENIPHSQHYKGTGPLEISLHWCAGSPVGCANEEVGDINSRRNSKSESGCRHGLQTKPFPILTRYVLGCSYNLMWARETPITVGIR